MISKGINFKNVVLSKLAKTIGGTVFGGGTGIPRFNQLNEGQSLMIEDSVTNLVSTNIYSPTTITGFTKVKGTELLTIDTTHKVGDNNSIHCHTPGSVVGEGFYYIQNGLTGNQKYTIQGSTYLPVGNLTVTFSTQDWSWITSLNITSNGGFVEWTKTLTLPSGKTGVIVEIQTSTTAQSIDIYNTCNIIANNPVHVTQIAGGITRPAESVQIPSSAICIKETTIEVTAYITSSFTDNTNPHYLFSHQTTDGNNHINLYHSTTTNQLIFEISDMVTTTQLIVIKALTTGYHNFAIAFKNNLMELDVDGVKVGSMTAYHKPVKVGNAFLGSLMGTSGFANASFNNLVISNRFRPFVERQLRANDAHSFQFDNNITYYLPAKISLNAYKFRNNNNGNAYPQPSTVITFDDGYTSTYTIAYPYMENKGMVGTVFVIPSLVGTAGFMTLAQLTELHEAGWTIANHTYDHLDLTTLTEAQQEAEILNGKNWLIVNGFTDGSNFLAFPFGTQNADSITALTNLGIAIGRLLTVACQRNPRLNPNSLSAYCVKNANPASTPTDVLNFVPPCVTNKSSTIFVLHNITDTITHDEDITIANFESIIDGFASAGYRTLNLKDWYNEWMQY